MEVSQDSKYDCCSGDKQGGLRGQGRQDGQASKMKDMWVSEAHDQHFCVLSTVLLNKLCTIFLSIIHVRDKESALEFGTEANVYQ